MWYRFLPCDMPGVYTKVIMSDDGLIEYFNGGSGSKFAKVSRKICSENRGYSENFVHNIECIYEGRDVIRAIIKFAGVIAEYMPDKE